VEVPQHATVHAEHVAETHEFAFDGAAAALERNLGRDRERARELSRRPKKYFVAKRLLTPETPAIPSSANRARRRKSA
jgi:ribosome-associated translation inhibitor RaiA